MHTNYVDTITNSVVTSLDVLKSVNDMYSSNFTLLLTVMGLLVGFGAVVLPLWFQFREAKTRRLEMQTEFQEFIDKTEKDLTASLQKTIQAQAEQAKKDLVELEIKLNKKWASVMALGAHAQMKIAVRDKEFHHAAETSLTAIRGFCLDEDHSNLLRIVGYLATDICPHLKKADFENEYFDELFKTVEKELLAENKSGFLSDKLEQLKQAKKEAKQRA